MYSWISLYYRYSITRDLNQSHLVLGKMGNLTSLQPDELAILSGYDMEQSTAKIYHRVLISGILYTTSSYLRAKVKSDCVLSFKRNGEWTFGIVKHYLSFCNTTCADCMKPCKHCVIITPYKILPLGFRPDGTTIEHIHRIFSTKFVAVCTFIVLYICCHSSETRIFYTQEIENKCVCMKFSLPDTEFIIELPNNKEKNL